MSFGVVGKRGRSLGVAVWIWLIVPGAGWAQIGEVSPVSFGTPTAGCPPCYKHCQEGPPRLHYRRGCPHPICNPCDLPHFGYWEPCWSPFPYKSDWLHCPVPPPAAYVNLNPLAVPIPSM